MYGGRAPKGELCNKVCMYVCMYVCMGYRKIVIVALRLPNMKARYEYEISVSRLKFMVHYGVQL